MMKKKRFVVSFIFLLIFHTAVLFPQDNKLQFSACDGRVLQITEDSSGELLAVCDDKNVIVYNLSDYSQVCELFDEKVTKLSFYDEGENKYLAVMTKNGQFIVRKLLFENEQWFCEDGEPYFSADCADAKGQKALTALAFSNNSDYVAAAFDDNTVQVHFRLRVTAGSISHTITNHKAPVYGLEFSKSGEYLATVSIDGAAYIWNSYTSTLITKLNGIYARARVPVYFTSDSVYIVSLDTRNSFRISDFSGNTLYSILTGRPITAIKPLKDPDLIAIRNDKNEVMVYSISSRRPLSVTTVSADDAEFTSFEFVLDAEQMYAGFSNGLISIFESQPYLDETSMLVTDSSFIGQGKGELAVNHFQGLSVDAGLNYLNKPYLYSIDMNAEYRYCDKTAPWFFGGGILFQYGFPRSDFPANYKIRGQQVNPPNLLSAAIYVPTGFIVSPWGNFINLITEIKVGAKASTLALLSGGYIIGDPVYSVFVSGGAGIMIKNFETIINFEYDTVGKLSPSIYAGYVIKWGNKK